MVPVGVIDALSTARIKDGSVGEAYLFRYARTGLGASQVIVHCSRCARGYPPRVVLTRPAQRLRMQVRSVLKAGSNGPSTRGLVVAPRTVVTKPEAALLCTPIRSARLAKPLRAVR